jgi:site-specific recombinase XerD
VAYGATDQVVDIIQKAWSRETFRKYRRTLTRLAEYLKETRSREEDLIQPEKAPVIVAGFVAARQGDYSPSVMRTMMGHLNRVIQIFDHRSGNALLRVIGRAIGRQAPTPSRRYDTIWDVNALLGWITQNWQKNEELELGDLQTKAMMIVMIFSACRLAELGRMERPADADVHEDVITLKTITKQRQETKQQIVMRSISLNALCPVATVRAWLRRMPVPDHDRLFCLLRGQETTPGGVTAGRVLTTPDICKRFLRVMKEAGIPSHYTAYSIKHAVVTKLFQLGATEEQIGAYGHWAQGSRTAQRWYNIATLDKDWLGTKLVGQWLHTDPVETLEDFDNQYMPVSRTPEQATTRAHAVELMMEARAPPRTRSDVRRAERKA